MNDEQMQESAEVEHVQISHPVHTFGRWVDWVTEDSVLKDEGWNFRRLIVHPDDRAATPEGQ